MEANTEWEVWRPPEVGGGEGVCGRREAGRVSAYLTLGEHNQSHWMLDGRLKVVGLFGPDSPGFVSSLLNIFLFLFSFVAPL